VVEVGEDGFPSPRIYKPWACSPGRTSRAD
jgi:hypothetical protein